MPKFRSKPKTVDAEQFTDRDNPPRGVRVDDKCRYVETIQGRLVEVSKGEWIVDEGDGIHFYPIADTTFKNNYEPTDFGTPISPQETVDEIPTCRMWE